MELNFLNNRHKERYEMICKKNSKCLDERDYAVAAYMLSISKVMFDTVINYISDIGISFDDIYEKQDLTPAMHFYIKVVDSLFRWNEIPLNLSDLKRLDYPHLFGVLNGLYIYTDFENVKKNFEYFEETLKNIKDKQDIGNGFNIV